MDLVFSEDQIERYSRYIILQQVGGEGQKKLLKSSALVIGAGGLGSPALLYLAAAGVGRLGVVDFHRAGYKPSPLGGNVFSKYFPIQFI